MRKRPPRGFRGCLRRLSHIRVALLLSFLLKHQKQNTYERANMTRTEIDKDPSNGLFFNLHKHFENGERMNGTSLDV